jgi:tetratricopeptide (TPR) repeat protein
VIFPHIEFRFVSWKIPPGLSGTGHQRSARYIMDAHYALLTDKVIDQCDRLASAPWDPDAPVHVIAPKFRDISAEAIMACRTATDRYPEARRFWFQLGRAYDKSRQYDDAANNYEKAEQMGSTSAMVNLGILYERGTGKHQNQERARHLYEKSARSGNSEGMYCFATTLEYGIGGAHDITLAKYFYGNAGIMGSEKARAALEELLAGRESGLRCNS